MAWAQVTTIIASLAAVIGMQAFWVSRALDRVSTVLDRVEAKLDRIEIGVLRDHGERIARLEAARDA